MKLTKERLAEILNGRQYRDEITKEQAEAAKESNLVVIFGASDDLVEFRGAVHEEIGAYNGITFGFTRGGLINGGERGVCIEARWDDHDLFDWHFRTSVPHAKFIIYNDDATFCQGIVINLDDL